jgi:HK97 gp10 family phage protein
MAFNLQSVPGLSDLHNALQELPAKIEANVMAAALKEGQKSFLAAVYQRMPNDDTGALRRSVKVRVHGKSKKFGYVRAQLVVGNKQAWYGKFIEYGTASYYTGKGQSTRKPYIIRAKTPDGKEYSKGQKQRMLAFGGRFFAGVTHPGVKPRPFMRPAFDNPTTQNDAIQHAADYIRGRLPREVKKLARLRARA